jgi:hypothetical protein
LNGLTQVINIWFIGFIEDIPRSKDDTDGLMADLSCDARVDFEGRFAVVKLDDFGNRVLNKI